MQLNGFPIERKKLSELTKAPYNPRKITPEQAASLQRSLTEFGTVEPIIWNKQTGHIVGGHQRLDALQSLGETETDVLIVDMPEEREQALNIALNKISGEWDNGMLSDLLLSMHEELRQLTGFSDDEIAALLPKQEGLTDPDAVPEVTESIAKLGDIWQLGEHRLMCGDSTDAGSVALLMNGGLINIIVSSPPYYNQRDYANWPTIKDYEYDIRKVVENALLVRDEPFALVWNIGSSESTNEFLPAHQYQIFREIGLKWREWIVWNKESATWTIPRSQHIENGHYFPALKWETIFVFTGESHPKFDVSDKSEVRDFQTNVWDIKKVIGSQQKKTGHTAMFPIEIPKRAIMAYSQRNGKCFEPFCGSGTTLIACEQLNRKCYGMELDPHYCDVIIKRWEDFTGKKAVKVA